MEHPLININFLIKLKKPLNSGFLENFSTFSFLSLVKKEYRHQIQNQALLALVVLKVPVVV
ncbi:MAG: hypothetical protein ACSHWT_08190, partial [Glaciecola sp.]